MRRHLLLKRQQQRLLLEARLLKTQPIVERSTRQQALLPDTLGLYATPSPDNRATNRVIEAQFQMLASIGPENKGNSLHEVDSLAKSEQEWLPPTTSSLLVAEKEEAQLPTEVTTPAELPSSAEPTIENEQATIPAELLSSAELDEQATTPVEPPFSAEPMIENEQVTMPAELPSSIEPGPQEETRQDLQAPSLAGDTRQPPLSQEQPEPPISALAASEVLTSEAAGASLPVLPRQDSQKQFVSNGPRTRHSRVQEITLEHNASAPGIPARTSEIDNGPQNTRQKAGMREESKIQPQTKPGNPDASFAQPGSVENTEELFAPRESDRSPQAWLARLNLQAQGEHKQVKNEPLSGRQEHRTEQRQPEPISQHARTFLKPLLGIDPGEVPIYRDAQAAQASSDLDADAFSTGQAIEVATGHTQETPETLGLLAHELTHVARQQRPRFIPPVARPQASPGNQASDLEMLDEEALALHVEQRVRRAMRAVPAPHTLDQEPPVAPGGPPIEPDKLSGGKKVVDTTNADRGIWGNLPAPWEPLPDWLVSPPASSVTPTFPAPTMSWQASGSSFGSVSARPVLAETALQHAGTERRIDNTDDDAGEEGTSVQSAPGAAREPEPDLDELARQVYGLLKRRLSVEQRRGV